MLKRLFHLGRRTSSPIDSAEELPPLTQLFVHIYLMRGQNHPSVSSFNPVTFRLGCQVTAIRKKLGLCVDTATSLLIERGVTQILGLRLNGDLFLLVELGYTEPDEAQSLLHAMKSLLRTM